MRISDWSSDVCSSDLVDAALAQPGAVGLHRLLREGPDLRGRQPLDRAVRNFAEEYMEGRRFAVDGAFHLMLVADLLHALAKLTRDAVRLPVRLAGPPDLPRGDRTGVVWGKSVSLRV